MHRLGIPGRRLPAGEQARLSERRGRRACARLRQRRQCRHRRHREIHRQPGPAGSQRRRLQHHRGGPQAGPALASTCACSTPCATSSQKGMAKFKAKAAAGAILDVNTGEIDRPRVAAGLRSQQPGRRARERPHQPHQCRRLRDGLDLQGAHDRDGARFRQVQHQLDASMRAPACATASSPSATITRRTASSPCRRCSSTRPTSAPPAWRSASASRATRPSCARWASSTACETELPENAEPIVPPRWGELNTMTIAFGHGLAVAPLQALMAVGALVNGGMLITPTFLKRDEAEARPERPAGHQARDQRGDALRDAPQRLEPGRAPPRKAAIAGFFVGGKTGTAEKVINGRYSKNKNFTTFTAVVPADKPKYVFLTIMDEPQARAEGTYGFSTAGWNAGAGHRQHHRARRAAARRAAALRAAGAALPADVAPRRLGHAMTMTRAIRLGDLLPEAQATLRRLASGRGSPPTAARSEPGTVFFAVPGTKADGMSFAPQAVAAGAVADRRRGRAPGGSAGDVAYIQRRRRAPRARARGRALLSAPARKGRRRHRHERQELGRRFRAPALRGIWATSPRASARSASSRRTAPPTAR